MEREQTEAETRNLMELINNQSPLSKGSID
jgi:hypothetical protein